MRGTFGEGVGKIVGLFEEEWRKEIMVLNERGEMFRVDTTRNGNEIWPIKDKNTFGNHMYLPMGCVRSINSCFYLVLGAHSFTSQQLSNIIILSDKESTRNVWLLLGRCIRSVQSQLIIESDRVKANLAFNWDDLLLHVSKYPELFIELLKLSLLIYD